MRGKLDLSSYSDTEQDPPSSVILEETVSINPTFLLFLILPKELRLMIREYTWPAARVIEAASYEAIEGEDMGSEGMEGEDMEGEEMEDGEYK